MNIDPSKNSNFYFEYHRIGSKAFRDKVSFYEDHSSQISTLTYQERIDVELDYAICLFEIGRYHKFLSKADVLIETVIIDNIFDYNGINIYNDLLFKKAACYFNTGQFIKSERILKALLKLEPENNVARSLYGKCKRKQAKAWYQTSRAISIIMLISATSITFLEWFIVRPFYSDYTNTLFWAKIILLSSGIFILIANELYLYYIIGKNIGFKFQINIQKRKTSKMQP